MFSNQTSEINPKSPQFAGVEQEQHGNDIGTHSFMPSREAHSIGRPQ